MSRASAGPSKATKFATGQSNPTYLIEGGERPLRAAPQAAGQAAQERAYDRARVSRAEGARGHGLSRRRGRSRSARTRASSARRSTSWPMSRAASSGTRRCPSSPREERGQIFDAMNEGLAKLHAIDVAAAGLSDFGKPGSYFARQLQRWTEQYRASETETDRGHGAADRLARAPMSRPTTAASRWCTATGGSTT